MLQVMENGTWKPITTAQIDPDSWNATFRVPAWDATRDREYRVLYEQHAYNGTIQRDPVNKPDIMIGLLTCIWDFGFPHSEFVKHLGHHRPDVLFWTGDQIYEPVGGFGVTESRESDMLKPAMVDFLRKWFIFGWAVRELTRDIPSVCMTDDHDMFHGNIWGCGGRPTNPAISIDAAQTNTVRYDRYAAQDSGGYKMPARWVNIAQRAQTAHLPDPFDGTPVLQGIGVYYTSLRWGGVSFAILEDRKWKSAPKQQLPEANIVNGFSQNPQWDAATHSDVLTAELLGQRQLSFLEAWAADWSGGTWMKFAVSQTLFGCLHTEPSGVDSDGHDPEEAIPKVGAYIEGDHMVADHDSAGWPQHGRNAAILRFRKGFAAHLCGDQHLGTMSHYGVAEFRDGVYAVCTPAISNIWPRRWYPPGGNQYTGDHKDAFGNRFSVFAVANPARYPGPGLDGLRFRVTGYTILTCNRETRRTTVAAWPRWVDPSAAGAKPYEGWPVVIEQLENGLCGAQWELQPIETTFRDAVVQVQKADGDVVYTLRINGQNFTPVVRQPGSYRLIAYDPDGDYRQEWDGLQAHRKNAKAQ
jgi:alkaline phosphatase D